MQLSWFLCATSLPTESNSIVLLLFFIYVSFGFFRFIWVFVVFRSLANLLFIANVCEHAHTHAHMQIYICIFQTWTCLAMHADTCTPVCIPVCICASMLEYFTNGALFGRSRSRHKKCAKTILNIASRMRTHTDRKR